MAAYSIDDARKLADEFKREGYFDQLKRDVLTQKHGNDELPLEQSIRNTVTDIVKKMVTEDENLIFKNRGSTSALIEAQLFKQGYKRLGEGDNGIQLEEYLHKVMNNSELTQDIKNKLNRFTFINESDEPIQNDEST